MRGIAVIGALLLASLGQPAEPDWLQAQHPGYTIYYQSGYEADRDFSAMWLDRAEALMRSKYGVTSTGHLVSFYLYPVPNEHAGIGHAQGESTDTLATIHYLSPSAPPWKATRNTTSLRLPF